MRSDTTLGALVLVLVVLLIAGSRQIGQRRVERGRERSAQLENGERVRLMFATGRRTSGPRVGD